MPNFGGEASDWFGRPGADDGDPRDAGRDLGLSALAGNLGQAVAPLLGGAIITGTHGYTMLWLIGAAVAFAAAACVLRVGQLR